MKNSIDILQLLPGETVIASAGGDCVLPFIRNLHEQTTLSIFQIAMGVVAIFFGGIPFANAFDPERKKFCCVAIVYLLIMAVFGFLAYKAYLPIVC